MQNCMKLSGTIEMTVAEFFVNLTFEHQREGLFLSTITDIGRGHTRGFTMVKIGFWFTKVNCATTHLHTIVKLSKS